MGSSLEHMENKILIGSKIFHLQKPTFIILDSLKQETGFDFALGISKEQNAQLVTDMKRVPKVIAIMTCDEPGESYDEKKIEARTKYFYENAEYNDFINAMIFFSNQLRLKGQGSQEAGKGKQSKLKLVKTK